MNHIKNNIHINNNIAKDSKILVTGATGFVGSYLVPELLLMGYSVRALTRDLSHMGKDFSNNPKIEIWEGDICKPETIKGIAEGVEWVIHLAAEGHVSSISEESFKRFISVNVDGVQTLLKECALAGVARFIHFSSTAAMGLIKKKGRVDENDLPCPVTPYQKSKLASESVALELGKTLSVPVIVLRPCMIYGIGGYGEFYKIARLVRKGVFPKVGLGKNLTPLVHVKDVVRAAILAAENATPYSVYLVASEKSLSLSEMRTLILEGWQEKSFYPFVPSWFMYSAAWIFEKISQLTGSPPIATRQNILSTIWDREFSIQKAKNEIGYHPYVDLSDGIHETVRWFKGQS